VSGTPNLRISREDGGVVAALSGEIDIVNAGDIADGLVSGIDGASTVIVDLDGVLFMDSQGVAMLDRLSSHVDAAASALAIVARPASIPRRVLEIVDLGIPLFDDIDAARTAMRARSIGSSRGSAEASSPLADGSTAPQA
jgi:anti-anti-sigma factor